MTYHEWFEHRLRSDPGAPLITWYDLDAGARVELSATTFGNWVDKTVLMLVEEVDLEEGELVALPLLTGRPGHWMTLVLVAACWHLGAGVALAPEADVRLVIGGPEIAADPSGRPTWAVSLHPLGVGLPTTAPGVLDWADEVRAYADLHVSGRGEPADLAWTDPPVNFADLAPDTPAAERRLIVAGDPWDTVRAGLITPIMTGGSVVLIEGTADPDRLRSIGRDEQARV